MGPRVYVDGLEGATHTTRVGDTTTSSAPAGDAHASPSMSTVVAPAPEKPTPVRVTREPPPPKCAGAMAVTLAPTVRLTPPAARPSEGCKCIRVYIPAGVVVGSVHVSPTPPPPPASARELHVAALASAAAVTAAALPSSNASSSSFAPAAALSPTPDTDTTSPGSATMEVLEAFTRSASTPVTLVAQVALVAHAAVYCLESTRIVTSPAGAGVGCRVPKAHVTKVVLYVITSHGSGHA
mmetsp:Transcript_37964/g.94100  ORF Transcript_37964/g.94100 Transcript_37964/m.94100 type:complete len:239 (+) Transcript_37964:5648-6364(+)